MKHLVIAFSCFIGNSLYSQNQIPSFPGGSSELNKFLSSNIKAPERWKESGISCRVYVKFTVNTDSTLSDIKILKGCPGFPECDAEVLRVVPLMPKWIPALEDGKAIKRGFSLPVDFKQR
jgi:protein TonB